MISLKQPSGLWALSFGSLCDTFSYFGTQTILILYLIKIFDLNQSDSYLMYGAYAALAYTIPILGGFIGDRWLGGRYTLFAGLILNIAGNLLLMSFSRFLFCLGLALALIGVGFFKSNAMGLIGKLYTSNAYKKEQGYTWLYIFINIGGALGPLLYGLIIFFAGWHYIFLCNAVILSIALFSILRYWHHLSNEDEVFLELIKSKLAWVLTVIVVVSLLLTLLFYYPISINPVIIIMFLIGIAYLYVAIKKQSSKERKKLVSLVLLYTFAIFYFATGLQTGTTVILFIQGKIHEGVIQLNLPASTFSMLYCLFVLILTPLFTYLWTVLKAKNIHMGVFNKLIFSILFAALGMFAFMAAASTDQFIIIFILMGYLFLSAGELVITPAAYTAISNLSPSLMKSTMMGYWLLFIGMGGYLSSQLATLSHVVASHVKVTSTPFLSEFMFIALLTLAAALLLIIIKYAKGKWLNYL